jgi:hypothetical protein
MDSSLNDEKPQDLAKLKMPKPNDKEFGIFKMQASRRISMFIPPSLK